MKVILSKLSFHWSVLVIFTSLRKRLKSILARALVRVQCQGRGNGVVVNAGVAIYFFTRRSSDRSREARNFFSLSWNYESPPYLIDSTFIKLDFTKINHLIKLVVRCVLKKITWHLNYQSSARRMVTWHPLRQSGIFIWLNKLTRWEDYFISIFSPFEHSEWKRSMDVHRVSSGNTTRHVTNGFW